MTHRSTFALALLGALAVTAVVAAKPPDLPIDPNDTIPLLAPPTPFDTMPQPTDDTPPMPLPLEMMPIYHPVRPAVAPSVKRTFEKCLLFGAHPLLSLVPLPKVEEKHEIEMVTTSSITPSGLPVSVYGVWDLPGSESVVFIETDGDMIACSLDEYVKQAMTCPLSKDFIGVGDPTLAVSLVTKQCQLRGRSLLFGMGVNSDAGLIGCVVVKERKRPWQIELEQETSQELPKPKEESQPPAGQVCPWKGNSPCDHRVPAIADVEVTRTVLENLEQLERADSLYEKACGLVKCGKYPQAFACLKEACELCPGSRYEEMSAELIVSVVWQWFGGRDADADAEEQEEQPIPCKPYWKGNEPDDCCSGCCTDFFWLFAETPQPKPETCKSSCGMPCCKEAGVAEEVTGLLKACHLALNSGNHQKAAELAREAFALDPKRVEADPIVYKMHLLALKHSQCGCCEPCDEPDCCCHAAQAANRSVGSVIVNNLPVPCLRIEMLPPSLPPVEAAVVRELDQLVIEDVTATAKPNLEVVEEESEVHEIPRAIDKPFRVKAPVNGVVSCDDWLWFIPGETWTEFDAQTQKVRLLWRMTTGGVVYRLHYDGDLSFGLSVTPMAGSTENCEEK